MNNKKLSIVWNNFRYAIAVSCVFFTGLLFVRMFVTYQWFRFLNVSMENIIGIFSLSLAFGFSLLVFRIKILPWFSRYIINYIVLYAGFISFVLFSNDINSSNSAIVALSIFFTLLYLLIILIRFIAVSIFRGRRSKDLDYKKQF